MANRTHDDVEERLTALARRIYERYGTNLSAYFHSIEEADRECRERGESIHDTLGACYKKYEAQHVETEARSQLSRESGTMHIHQR